MAKDSFYREMSDHQLQAAYKELKKNIEFDPSDGMIEEMELLQNVSMERNVELDNSISAVRGYLEFAFPELPKTIKLSQRERHYLENLLQYEIEGMESQNVSDDFFELKTAKIIINKLGDTK